MRCSDERKRGNGPGRWLPAAVWGGLCLAIVALAGNGCAHARAQREARERAAALIPPPTPPFLNGPAALLLTNSGGFSCHLVMVAGSSPQAVPPLVGELFGRGSKLFFSPGPSSFGHRAGGFGFLWDVAEGRGILLCDAMQGYAPISSHFRATNVVVRATGQGSQKIAGHECEPMEVSVSLSEGPMQVLRMWQAMGWKDFPLRLSSAEGPRFDLTLSNVRLEVPVAEMFQPPEGFARFESPEGMMAEMVMRQEKLKRKPGEESLTPDVRSRPETR